MCSGIQDFEVRQPVEELRLYYRGLKFKRIRVPVQRLIILLPIEEQDEPNYLSKVKAVDEETVGVKAVEEKTVEEHAFRELHAMDDVEEGKNNVVASVKQRRIEVDENFVVNEV